MAKEDLFEGLELGDDGQVTVSKDTSNEQTPPGGDNSGEDEKSDSDPEFDNDEEFIDMDELNASSEDEDDDGEETDEEGEEEEGDDKSDKDTKDKDESDTDEYLDSDEESTNTLSPFATALAEQGILSDSSVAELKAKLEEEDGKITASDLLDAVNKEIEAREFADLNDDAKGLVEVLRNGGDVRQYLTAYQAQRDSEEKYQEITDDNAKDFLNEYYQLRGFSKEEALDMVEDLEVTGKLTEKAKENKPRYDRIVKESKENSVEQAKARKQQEAKAKEDALNELKEKVYGTKELVKGHTLNKSVKDKLFDLITKPTEKGENGQPVTKFRKAYEENPLEVEMYMNYFFMLTDGFKDLSKLTSTKANRSSAVNELDKKLEQERKTSQGKKGSPKQNNNSNKSDILDALDNMTF